MENDFEGILKRLLREKPAAQPGPDHPGEEELAGLRGNTLAAAEKEAVIAHLLACARCAERFALALESESLAAPVPRDLLRKALRTLKPQDSLGILEIVLEIKGRMMELVRSSGDVVFGQELIPAPVLRARRLSDFTDEVVILRDFERVRVEVKVENKGGRFCAMAVQVSDKRSGSLLKDVRVSLLREETELESYAGQAGRVVFEHVDFGTYRLVVTALGEAVAAVRIELWS